MKNYIKQILRTPMQSVLITILIMIVTVMLVTGGNLWATSYKLSKSYENDFITIGTVTQKPDTVADVEIWDAEKQDYRIYKTSKYNSYTTVDDLDFPEAAYILKPEKRGYWGSYVPEYVHATDTWQNMRDYVLAVEFSPKEDVVPDHSVKIEITKVLGTDKTMEGTVVWFCDHTNRYPKELKADKTYVALITETAYTHGKEWEDSGNTHNTAEYAPWLITTTLYTADGQRIEDSLDVQGIYELTEGFYNTLEGQRFLAIADMAVVYYDTQPVVGTNSTNLLMPFYEGSAWVYEGRYPTEEEYVQGSAVCLAPGTFAENNGLSVGDQIITRLYYTNTGEDVAVNFGLDGNDGYSFQLLGSDGKLLEPFEEKEYTIVGLYDYSPSVSGIARDELIVPLNSVEHQYENLVSFGAMSDENTSFQIENGTIAEYLESIEKHGMDNLIFTFYDRGYSALVEGIRNLRNMSAALLIMGLIAAVILTLQIAHIYVTKQKRRLSIERLMGMTGKQCRNITLTGVLILLLIGTVPGVAAGMAVSNHVDVEDMGQEDFSRKYSNLGLAAEIEVDSSDQRSDTAVSCIMGGLVIVLGMGISGVKLQKILREEPLYLLEDGMLGK